MSLKLLNSIKNNVPYDLLQNIYFINSQQYKAKVTHGIKHNKPIVDTIKMLKYIWSNKTECLFCNNCTIKYIKHKIEFYNWILNYNNKFIIKSKKQISLPLHRNHLLSQFVKIQTFNYNNNI